MGDDSKEVKKKELATLITAIDWSGSKEYPKHIFALVSIDERNLPKLSELLINKLRVKHWEKLRSKEKTIYTEKFMRRWEEIKRLLERVDVKFHFQDLLASNYDIIERSKELIIDDTTFKRYMGSYEGKGKLILESHTFGFRRAFINLADNIANIVRRLLKKKKSFKEKYEVLNKFRK